MGACSSKSHSEATSPIADEMWMLRMAKLFMMWGMGRWVGKSIHRLLGLAAFKGRVRDVALLLNKQPWILEAENYDRETLVSPLHVAAFAGHVNVVSLLLNYPGVDVKKTWKGTTALHTAAAH